MNVTLPETKKHPWSNELFNITDNAGWQKQTTPPRSYSLSQSLENWLKM